MITVAGIIDHLDRFAPPRTAADWDNVGLLLGQRSTEVQRIMTCLTITEPVAAEALNRRANLIVTHHPILFRAVKRLTGDTPEGRMLLSLIQGNVAVHSPHTAFDNAVGGINDLLAGKLGLADLAPLRKTAPQPATQFKIVVFVPDADLQRVSDALFESGAGQIGEYSECSYRLSGIGTFRGSDASNPTIGQKGRREEVQEHRLEVVCPSFLLGNAVAALRKAHSYEEPAFDIYPLTAAPSGKGEGRIGVLPASMPLGEVAKALRSALQCGPVQVVGDLSHSIRKVAIVCGAGGELLMDAIRAKADVFLTGEMRYHDYLAATSAGVDLILPGHHATERFGVEELARMLHQKWPDLEIWASQTESDPVKWI